MPEFSGTPWRLLLALAFPLLLWAGLRLLRRWQLARANAADRAFAGDTEGAAVVYFWSTDCPLCRTAQGPILERLGVRLHSHQVEACPDLARAWGVSTLPTTFVVAAGGAVRFVNNGLASEATLRRQLGLSQAASIVPSITRSASS